MDAESAAAMPSTSSWESLLAIASSILSNISMVTPLISPVAIIFLGAHASLRRPPSAAPSQPRPRTPAWRQKQKKKDTDDDEEKFTEGLTASDAILFPLLAGMVLIGLYYLIEWLKDADILNKIVRGYMTLMSLGSVARLAADALDIGTSLVFPSFWADRSGKVYCVDGELRRQLVLKGAKDGQDGEEEEAIVVPEKTTPLPGWMSEAALPKGLNDFLWTARWLLTEKWTVKLGVHGIGLGKFDVGLNGMLGFLVSIPVAVAYHVTNQHVWSNIIATGLCYGTSLLLTPTSFGVGTLVLSGLFVYDIVMVFYTPYMITVAKKLDAPIKLVFQSSSGVGMLGLGDIVIPGMMMGLALRFDLDQYYRKKMTLKPVELASETVPAGGGEAVTSTETKNLRVKAPWVEPQGQWGNRFWTMGFKTRPPAPEAGEALAATGFPKPYFYASMTGYLVGMIVTVAVLHIFQHGQPALLYLVPGVTGSLFLTALLRDELKEFWAYTEDGSLDTKDVVVEVDGDGNVTAEGKEKESGAGDVDKVDGPPTKGGRSSKDDDESYEVFVFSVKAPRPMRVHDDHQARKKDE